VKREYKSKKGMLLEYMSYFEQYLKEETTSETLDISVHCDVVIFEWLL
jgi:hypothetical protein